MTGDPELRTGEQLVISVNGTLDNPVATVNGHEDKVNIKCTWTDNDKQ